MIPSSSRGNNFDAIRLAMALLVVWSHSFAIHWGNEYHEWIYRLTNKTATAGTVGVMVFFIISGFLIAKSFERSSSLKSYIEKRISRIYPGYMVATCICAFVVIPLFSTHCDLGFFRAVRIILRNLLLQNSFPKSDVFASNPLPYGVNGSLWSIPLEFGCYIMVAALGIAGLLSRGRMIIVAIVVTLGLRVTLDAAGVQPHAGIAGHVLLWMQVIPSFLLGIAVYAYRDVLPRDRDVLVILLFGAMVACWLGVGSLLLAPAIAYAVFYVAYADSRFHGAAKHGDFSYGCYLYAFVIQQILQEKIGGISLAAFIILSMALSLGAGVLSWHLVEKHFKEPSLQIEVNSNPHDKLEIHSHESARAQFRPWRTNREISR